MLPKGFLSIRSPIHWKRWKNCAAVNFCTSKKERLWLGQEAIIEAPKPICWIKTTVTGSLPASNDKRSNGFSLMSVLLLWDDGWRSSLRMQCTALSEEATQPQVLSSGLPHLIWQFSLAEVFILDAVPDTTLRFYPAAQISFYSFDWKQRLFKYMVEFIFPASGNYFWTVWLLWDGAGLMIPEVQDDATLFMYLVGIAAMHPPVQWPGSRVSYLGLEDCGFDPRFFCMTRYPITPCLLHRI